jgi:hypothetical protein
VGVASRGFPVVMGWLEGVLGRLEAFERGVVVAWPLGVLCDGREEEEEELDGRLGVCEWLLAFERLAGRCRGSGDDVPGGNSADSVGWPKFGSPRTRTWNSSATALGEGDGAPLLFWRGEHSVTIARGRGAPGSETGTCLRNSSGV